jgi:hypothetical protein
MPVDVNIFSDAERIGFFEGLDALISVSIFFKADKCEELIGTFILVHVRGFNISELRTDFI